jgi:hypothetical protein
MSKPKLLDEGRRKCRLRHYSHRTEQAYVGVHYSEEIFRTPSGVTNNRVAGRTLDKAAHTELSAVAAENINLEEPE